MKSSMKRMVYRVLGALALFSSMSGADAAAQADRDCTAVSVLVQEREAGVYEGVPTAGYHGINYRGNFRLEEGRPVLVGHVEVVRVLCGSPAHAAGIRAGDLIVAVNGRDPGEPLVLVASRPGLQFDLRIKRGEAIRNFSIVSVARPPELLR
jgi:S1-C subfamily serine protease